MLHLTDEDVARLVSPQAAQATLRHAFMEFGGGAAAVQKRERTTASGIKLSTLGAVIPSQGVAGAKVYTTIKGQFGFVVLLFSAQDGRPVATLEAGALTRIRTAACSVLAAQACVARLPKVLGVFGLGVQGTEHVQQMAQAFPIERVLLQDPNASDEAIGQLSDRIRVPVRRAAAEDIAASSDLLVTASRSTTALFSGNLLREDAFVAAIGSSLPATRELDDQALRRARRVVVEWKPQSLAEAGDLVMAAPDVGLESKLVELAQLLGQPLSPAQREGIHIYKAVGIGLADVAVAGLAWRLLTEERRQAA